MTDTRQLATTGGRSLGRRLSEEAVDFAKMKAWLSDATGTEIDEIFRKPLPIQARLTEAIKLASKRYAKDNAGALATLSDLLAKRQPEDELFIAVRKYDPRKRQLMRTPVMARDWIQEQARSLYFEIISNAKPTPETVYTVAIPLFNHEMSPARKPLEEIISNLHQFAPRGCPQINCEIRWVGRDDDEALKQMAQAAAEKASETQQAVAAE